MDPMHRVRFGTMTMTLLTALLAFAAPSHAQYYDDVRRHLGLTPDPAANSPRLLGMGGLFLVAEDVHTRLDLWEFAGNPAGMLESDSVSTLEFQPGARTASSQHDLLPGDSRERQDFAMRDLGMSYEAFRRSTGWSAYGLRGSYGLLRTDEPVGTLTERRSVFDVPEITAVISARTSHFMPDRFRYGVRASYQYQKRDDRYRAFVANAAGQFIDRDGVTVNPPDFFTPDDRAVGTLGLGAGASYRIGRPMTLGVGFDFVSNRIEDRNDGSRYSSERREDRPYNVVQAAATGRIGRGLEYGADLRSWSSNSDVSWVFTLSTGQGGRPLNGRGRYMEREESGTSFQSRARWDVARLTFGAALSTYSTDVTQKAPAVGDPLSFNSFMNVLYNKAGTDTLVLPDSVVDNRIRDRAWQGALGVGSRLPFRDGYAGVEFHLQREKVSQDVAGKGPEQASWDVRSGVDLRLTRVLRMQAGYVYRWEDRDELTEQNEYTAQSVSLGMGLRPVEAVWGLDVSYAVDVARSDFGDPSRSSADNQRWAARLRWNL